MSGTTTGVCDLIGKFEGYIVNPLLELVFAAGLLVFIWGMVEYLWALGQGSNKKEQGQQHMIYGLGGMFIMVSAWAIIQLIASTVGANIQCTGL